MHKNNQPVIIDQDGISSGKKILFIIFLLLLLAPASIFIIFNFISPPTQTQAMYYDSVNDQYVPLANNSIVINGNMKMAGESEEFQFLTKPKDKTKDQRSVYKPKFSLSLADEGNYDKYELKDWVRFDSDRLKLVWTDDFVNSGKCDFILSISKGGYDFDEINITLDIGYQKLTILGPSVIEGAKPLGNFGDNFDTSKKYELIDETGTVITSNNSNYWKLEGDSITQPLILNNYIVFDVEEMTIKYTSIEIGQYQLQLVYSNSVTFQMAILPITIKIFKFMKINPNFPTNQEDVNGLVIEKDSSNNIIPNHSPTPPEVLERDGTPITSTIEWRIEPNNIQGLTCDSNSGIISWDSTFVGDHAEFNLIANCDGYYPAVCSGIINYKKDAHISGSDALTIYSQWNSESQYYYSDDADGHEISDAKWTIETYFTDSSFSFNNNNSIDTSDNIKITDNGKIIWKNKLITEWTSSYYMLKVIAIKNGYWSDSKLIKVTVKDAITFNVASTPSILPNSGQNGIPFPSNNFSNIPFYNSSSKTITLDYFHGHGGTISIPISAASSSPIQPAFKITSPTTNSDYSVLQNNDMEVQVVSDQIHVILGDDIKDNDEVENNDLYDEILITPSSYSYDKNFNLKLHIKYHANWFQEYLPDTVPVRSTDTSYTLKPITITTQDDSFFISTSLSEQHYKDANNQQQIRTSNTHLSNFYNRLDAFNGILPDNFFAFFAVSIRYDSNPNNQKLYLPNDVYIRFPNNIYEVGDNFMYGFMYWYPFSNTTISNNPNINTYIEMPNSLLKAGDNFMYNAFNHSNYSGSSGSNIFNYHTFNSTFTLPQSLLIVGNDFCNLAFYNLKTNDNKLPQSFNLPQNLISIGDRFCASAFKGSYINELSPVFNFPQKLSKCGIEAFREMFYNSQLTKLPLSLKFPSLKFVSNNVYDADVGDKFMLSVFYNCPQLTTLPVNFEFPKVYFDIYSTPAYQFVQLFLQNCFASCSGLVFHDPSSGTPPSDFRKLVFPNYLSGYVEFLPSHAPGGGTPAPGAEIWIKRSFS